MAFIFDSEAKSGFTFYCCCKLSLGSVYTTKCLLANREKQVDSPNYMHRGGIGAKKARENEHIVYS